MESLIESPLFIILSPLPINNLLIEPSPLNLLVTIDVSTTLSLETSQWLHKGKKEHIVCLSTPYD